MGPSLSPATQTAGCLCVKGTEISNTGGYKGENVPRKPHLKYVASDFLMVLAQRPTDWALQPVAPKDTSDNPAYSATTPHPLEEQHALHQPPSNSRTPGITQEQGFGLHEAGLQPPTPFPGIAEQADCILYSNTNRGPALLNRHPCVLESPQAQVHFKACRQYDDRAMTLKIKYENRVLTGVYRFDSIQSRTDISKKWLVSTSTAMVSCNLCAHHKAAIVNYYFNTNLFSTYHKKSPYGL